MIIDRQKEYGPWDMNAESTQGMLRVLKCGTKFNTLSDVHKESIHMILHKISRMCCGNSNNVDNAVDLAGYSMRLQEYIEEVNNEEGK